MSHPLRWRPLAGSLAGWLLATAACQQQSSAFETTAPAVAPVATQATARPTTAPFGKAQDGTAVRLFTLTNAHGLKATIISYGGTLTCLLVPDKADKLGDALLSFNSLAGYASNLNLCFGALIGRYGNRTAEGRFTLGRYAHQLPTNNSPNLLHGGPIGFNRRVWAAMPGTSADGPTLTLTYVSKVGEEGYPGTLKVQVLHTLTATNALRLAYTADKPTALNLTNHTYFNLNYGPAKDVLGHELTLNATRFTPVDNTLSSTGQLQAVAGTRFDFRQPYAIGERLGQVSGAAPGGYDHNRVLADGLRAQLAPAATVHEPTSGRTRQVYTEQPGVQFYSGNFLLGWATARVRVVCFISSPPASASKPSISRTRPTSRSFPAPCCGRARPAAPLLSTALACARSARTEPAA